MNGSTKLSLAIALALLGGGHAFALGLGAIQVKSALNQPLNAEIQVIADSPAEAAGLNVSLAKAEDFQRVGLDRARVSIPIDFEVITTGRNPVIRLTTKDPVREPFLDFLVEANWAKGRVLREYTVLLDPPVMAPALKGSTATVAPAHEAAPASSTRLESLPQKAKPAPRVKPPRAVAETRPAPAPKPAPSPKPAPTPAATRTASAGDYGPVAEGETLSEIARATKDENTDTNAMMLALLQANPNAFYKDNINALKRGAILRIPSHDDVKAAGNLAAAAAAVREQNQSWTSGNAPVSKPTLVARTGEPKSTPAPTTKPAASTKPNEHLALVPPASAKGGQASADQPGPASGTGNSTAARGDLARTKESLASREQEVGELKSRVKELEDINTKDQRLLSMKQSELADLQNKLKELESKSGTTAKPTTPPPAVATTTPATTPSTTTVPSTTAPTGTATKPADTPAGKNEPKLTAQDIWGKISDADKNASTTKPATTSTTPTTAASPTSTTTSPATTPSTATSPSSTPATSTAMTGPSSSTPTSTTPGTTAGSTPPSASSTTTAIATPASTTAASTPNATSPVAAVSTPAALKPKPTPSISPIPSPEQPWYQNTMTLAIAGGALLIVGLLALMRFMRKPKPVLLTSGDGDVPVEDVHLYGDLPTESEAELLDALAQHPGDPELSLKLLRMYYAERDASKFEAAAEAMYAHIADPTQPEWREVKAMGEDLVPHNPLFGGNDDISGYVHESAASADHETAHVSDDNFDLGGFDADGTPAGEENFDFDLTDHAAPTPAHAEPTHIPSPAPVAAAATLVAAKPAEDFFAGEDTIGTKLDLARAYLDMGDPEGARSMLDEVMSEGNDNQKGEARKLLAEIK
ncbi:MAG TPA: FimV/HubP family polar landmark protein [Rudaea sp.]|jgi:pilus assembly protein FimV|nr:FimV/HubP family polar landmark protein [Rudaea sp.]